MKSFLARDSNKMALLRVESWSATFIFGLSIIDICTSELILFQSIFRHGDRYPLSFEATKFFYPLNPHANVSWYPHSDGGLTIEGKRRSYELGKVLRARYGDWFRQRYSKKTARFISAGNERATMTASLVAAGLFSPDNGSQKWNPMLNWQPVQISSMRYPENISFFGCFLCSKYAELLEKTKLNDPTIVEYNERMKEIFDYVATKIGGPVTNRIMYYVYMELLASISGGLSPPKWAGSMLLDGSLKETAIQEYRHTSWTDELKRMTGGIWLKIWLDHVEDYVREDRARKTLEAGRSEEKKRAFFYSGHDVNVAGVMTTLGIFYPHVPNYVSAVNLELHEDENQQFYIKAVHRDAGEFLEYVIPGCGSVLCPLDTFRNIFSSVLPFNAPEDCGSFQLNGEKFDSL